VRWLASLVFVGLVVAANWLTARYGMVAGLVTAGTFAAGLVLLVRDWLQEAGGRLLVVVCIAVGAGAFGVDEHTDAWPSRRVWRSRRPSWSTSRSTRRCAGARSPARCCCPTRPARLSDSLLFLTLAGFPLASVVDAVGGEGRGHPAVHRRGGGGSCGTTQPPPARGCVKPWTCWTPRADRHPRRRQSRLTLLGVDWMRGQLRLRRPGTRATSAYLTGWRGTFGKQPTVMPLRRRARRRRRCRIATLEAVGPDARPPIRMPSATPSPYAAQNGRERPATCRGTGSTALFLGGDTAWKLSHHAADVTGEAHRRSVPVHMGRVNSLKRLRYADRIGCASADGTYLAFGPDRNLPTLLAWLRDVNGQRLLWEES
jgi:hypothetical protein